MAPLKVFSINIGPGATLTLPVSIANGGTGQTTATAAFNALSPLTTKGDLIVHNGTGAVRQAVGANGTVLTADNTQTTGVRWATNAAGLAIGDTVTSGTAHSVLFLGASNVLAQDNSYFYYDYTNHYLGLGTTSPSAHAHAVSTQQVVGNPTAGASSYSTVGAGTGYPAAGFGTNYVYRVYDSKVINGTTVYSATPATFTFVENIDPTNASSTQSISGSTYGVASPVGNTYKIYAIYADGKRSTSGASLFVQPDFTPNNQSATQAALGGGTGYTASGQTINYTIYPIFGTGFSGSGAQTFVNMDSSGNPSQVNLSWTTHGGLTPDNYLVVNTSNNTAVYTGSGFSTSTIDTQDWSAYSSPGGSTSFFTNNLSWTAPAHGGQVDYLVYNQGNNSAAYVGSTSTSLSDNGTFAAYSDPGATNLNFSLSWSNAADATGTVVQCSLLKPSNTYDFAGLGTSLADDSSGWGSLINTAVAFTLDTAIFGDGVTLLKNTSGNDQVPLQVWGTASQYSQKWFDESGVQKGYFTSGGVFSCDSVSCPGTNSILNQALISTLNINSSGKFNNYFFTPQEVNYGNATGTIATVDLATYSPSFKMNLTGNTTITAFTNMVTGAEYNWRFIQGSGNCTLTLPSNCLFYDGKIPIMTAPASGYILLKAYYDGINFNVRLMRDTNFDSNYWIGASSSTFTNVTTSVTYQDMGSIASLYPGLWDMTLIATVKLNGAVMTDFKIGISSTSGNSATGLVAGNNLYESAVVPVAGANQSAVVPVFRVSVASATTYYAKIFATFTSGNPQFTYRFSVTRAQ